MDYSLLLAVENNFAKYHQDKLLMNQIERNSKQKNMPPKAIQKKLANLKKY